jgi:hypothetical protein
MNSFWSIDRDYQIVLLTFSVTGTEDSKTWTWSVTFILSGITSYEGTRPFLTILKNFEEGIHTALSRLLPNVSHCYCVNQFEKNLKSLFKVELSFIQNLS